MTMDYVTRKKETVEYMKKAFSLKLLKIYKTRTKRATPDMFNFYVVLGGHDKVTDVGSATTRRCEFKAPSLKTKSTKKVRTIQKHGC